MCSNGMCASDQDSCLMSENGCPASLPYLCEANGICFAEARLCYSPYELMDHLSLQPPTGTENLCEIQG